jgi:single-strand DNA-binding protein
MASLNKVLLIGNLTRDPDVKMLSSGRPVCNFGLALNRSFKDGEGNRKEEVTFVDVECYGPRAEAIGRFFTKGRSIFVEGRLKLDQWESKEGEKRSAIRVVLDNFEFVDSKQEAAGTGERQPMANVSTKADTTPTPPHTESPNPSVNSDPDLDEDVPF